jgi:hypothetical protein
MKKLMFVFLVIMFILPLAVFADEQAEITQVSVVLMVFCFVVVFFCLLITTIECFKDASLSFMVFGKCLILGLVLAFLEKLLHL